MVPVPIYYLYLLYTAGPNFPRSVIDSHLSDYPLYLRRYLPDYREPVWRRLNPFHSRLYNDYRIGLVLNWFYVLINCFVLRTIWQIFWFFGWLEILENQLTDQTDSHRSWSPNDRSHLTNGFCFRYLEFLIDTCDVTLKLSNAAEWCQCTRIRIVYCTPQRRFLGYLVSARGTWKERKRLARKHRSAMQLLLLD